MTQERTPFTPLTQFEGPQGFFSINREPIGNPTVLVKELKHLILSPSEPPLDPNYDFDSFRDEVVEPIRLVTSHSSRVARFIPPVACVWGENMSGEHKGFIVMRRVFGTDIQNLSVINLEMAQLLDEAFSATFNLDSPRPNYRLSLDILQIDPLSIPRFHNIVIGFIAGEKPQPYFVDLYPIGGYIQPSTLKKAQDRRASWKYAVKDLSARSNDYQYPKTQAKFEAYIKEYEARIVFPTFPFI